MQRLYKKILVEKLLRFVCDIRYKVGPYSFEKPFRLAPGQTEDFLMESDSVKLVCLLDNDIQTFKFDDIEMFGVKETLTDEELENRLNRYKQFFSIFKNLKGKTLQDLFFRVDISENCYERLRHMRMMDALQLSHVDEYTLLTNNDAKLVNDLRELWQKLITEKYQQTIKALSEEKTASDDPSIVEELSTIEDILKSAPDEAKEELQKRTTIESVVEYWPTLLLPRSTVFWVDKRVNVS